MALGCYCRQTRYLISCMPVCKKIRHLVGRFKRCSSPRLHSSNLSQVDFPIEPNEEINSKFINISIAGS